MSKEQSLPFIDGALGEEPDALPTNDTPFKYRTIDGDITVEVAGATHLKHNQMQEQCDDCGGEGQGFRDVYYDEQHSTIDVVCEPCRGLGWVPLTENLCGCGANWVVTGSRSCADCLLDLFRDHCKGKRLRADVDFDPNEIFKRHEP